jgi:hypothetical protein
VILAHVAIVTYVAVVYYLVMASMCYISKTGYLAAGVIPSEMLNLGYFLMLRHFIQDLLGKLEVFIDKNI